MTGPRRPAPTRAQWDRVHDALDTAERAWRCYCSAANRNAPESTIAAAWREVRATRRAVHDVIAEVQRR